MINVEIKARCTPESHESVRSYLTSNNAKHVGTDRQTDTYFVVPNGRLKLREGNIENCLIQYDRADLSGPKVSKYTLSYFPVGSPIKQALTAALGVLVVVDKVRDIYYLGNIKIHLDKIADLGTFIEIEARDEKENIGESVLTRQTKMLMVHFGVRDEELIHVSYSDLILNQKKDSGLEAKAILQEWADKQGHDRCHYYPEIFARLCGVYGVEPKVEPGLPPRREFEAGCKKYQEEQYGEDELFQAGQAEQEDADRDE